MVAGVHDSTMPSTASLVALYKPHSFTAQYLVVSLSYRLSISPNRSSLTSLEATSPSLRSDRSMSLERSAASRSSTLTPQPMTFGEDSKSAAVER